MVRDVAAVAAAAGLMVGYIGAPLAPVAVGVLVACAGMWWKRISAAGSRAQAGRAS
jgi:hypothetical protein